MFLQMDFFPNILGGGWVAQSSAARNGAEQTQIRFSGSVMSLIQCGSLSKTLHATASLWGHKRAQVWVSMCRPEPS